MRQRLPNNAYLYFEWNVSLLRQTSKQSQYNVKKKAWSVLGNPPKGHLPKMTDRSGEVLRKVTNAGDGAPDRSSQAYENSKLQKRAF